MRFSSPSRIFCIWETGRSRVVGKYGFGITELEARSQNQGAGSRNGTRFNHWLAPRSTDIPGTLLGSMFWLMDSGYRLLLYASNNPFSRSPWHWMQSLVHGTASSLLGPIVFSQLTQVPYDFFSMRSRASLMSCRM